MLLKVLWQLNFLVCLLTGLSACSSLSTLDRDYLNHPAMELRQQKTPLAATPLTQLSNFRQSSTAGGCSSCAH